MIADEVIGTAEPVTVAAEVNSLAESTPTKWTRYRNIAGNICLAVLFLIVLIPTKSGHYNSTLATDIWFWGAVMMGVLSLVRVPPRSAMVNASSILSTTAMMVAPALMRPGIPATGLLMHGSIVVELIGIAFTQIARIYLGRRFGLLPANRGIVSGGPFRWMRHPIYSGWMILTIGFLMAYPDLYNIAMFVISLPFLVWRMSLEEEHLTQDPEYRAYLAKTRYRLFPGIY
jgi:protein-S-isoprenylcysteine O-methyltransferase Ste14